MKGKKFIAIISIVCILAVILCIPAFATVTESDGDGYVLCGGVKILSFDDLIAQHPEHPYIFVYWFNREIGMISLRFSDRPFEYDTYAYNKVFAPVGSEVILYGYSFGDTSWDYVDTVVVETTPQVSEPFSSLVWCSNDLIYDSVYVYNSLPYYSLTDMTVIEWDGNTDSLGVFEGVTYRIGDYVSTPISCFNSVYDNDSRTYTVLNDIISFEGGWMSRSAFEIPAVTSFDSVNIADAPSGLYFYNSGNAYTSLIAYRTIEEPPGEGGDTPDEPQPPFGRLKYTSNYIY